MNVLTGKRDELLEHMSSHMDVNAMLYAGSDKKVIKSIQLHAVENLKRVVVKDLSKPYDSEHESPYYIEPYLEMKTTWHPIEKIGAKGSGY